MYIRRDVHNFAKNDEERGEIFGLIFHLIS